MILHKNISLQDHQSHALRQQERYEGATACLTSALVAVQCQTHTGTNISCTILSLSMISEKAQGHILHVFPDSAEHIYAMGWTFIVTACRKA